MEKKRRALRKKANKKLILKEKEDKLLDLIAEIIVNMIMEDDNVDEESDKGVQNPLCVTNGSLEHNKSNPNH